ncbi:hypothetical protein IYX23_05665 [Methylocystis sp. L43]|nr:hypothetical protein [Methylocystis sp. H15]MBG0797174.1 hypothetical protein [Methylocystis sp. L43]MBG0804955.1 hypothetical protein [Methylocystis sp. H15]
MVTKPTGRPRGRPRKEQPSLSKGPRGAPKKPLAKDPDRYFLALAQAHVDCGALSGISERRVFEAFCGLRYGVPLGTIENIATMRQGGPFLVVTDKQRGSPGPEWHQKNTFRARADSLRKKLARMRKDPQRDPDARWLAAMSSSWFICLQGFAQSIGFAEFLAESVGEQEYFKRIMRPTLLDRSAQRAAGATRAQIRWPDFLPILFPRT